jgi:hypothetical protein
MSSLTFEYEGLEITVRAEIGADVWDASNVFSAIRDLVTNDPAYRVEKFIDFVLRSQVKGDLGFAWPVSVLDREAIRGAYPRWCALKKPLMIAWAEKLEEVNTAPGDTDLQPVEPGEALPPTP